MSTNDLYQSREWPAGTADKMNEWAESQLGFSLEPWQMDWLRQMEAPLPDPPLPDPLFGAWATHPSFGDVIVISHCLDEDEEVRLAFQADGISDGTEIVWVPPADLTFHTPDHPVLLKSEEDYASAPEGTIVANNDQTPAVLVNDLWIHTGPWKRSDHDAMADVRRRVLRWGWPA